MWELVTSTEFLVRTLLCLCAALAATNVGLGLGKIKAVPFVFLFFALGMSGVKQLRQSEQQLVAFAIVLGLVLVGNLIWSGFTISSLKKSNLQNGSDEKVNVPADPT
ncbi:MAG TPA: hypothetical protein DCY02_09535 [Armatimonadetes bacterium]|nr:hypothetical protein [Armatimonadota bacterium]HCM72974.1 hypothetical protein [Armatimonadota bacterium]HRD32435.1 hypothetical protein [Fimbriimonadaceae bacterium]